MEETTYLAIFIVLIAISLVNLVLALISPGGLATYIKNAAYGINKNVTAVSKSTSNAINVTLTPLSNSLSNSINSINPTISMATANILLTVSNNTAQLKNLNANVGVTASTVQQLSSNQISESTLLVQGLQQGSANANSLSGISNQIKNLNQNLSSIVGIGNLKLPVNANVVSGSYFFGQMLDGFANHINFTTDNQVTFQILTISQYTNYSTNSAYSTVSSSQSTNFNTWFNTSEGCGRYVYVVFGQNNLAFHISSSITAKYQPTAFLTGVCT